MVYIYIDIFVLISATYCLDFSLKEKAIEDKESQSESENCQKRAGMLLVSSICGSIDKLLRTKFCDSRSGIW